MTLPALVNNYVNYGDGSTTGHWGVAARALSTAYTVGQLVRAQSVPAVTNERVFVCVVAGTTSGSDNTAAMTVGRGGRTTDGTVSWQECTGQPATNGDLTNTLTWTASKAQASSPSLGVIVKDASNNLFICTVAGAVGGSEPTWNTTVGNTTVDSSATWTCIRNGAYGAWAAPHARLENAFAANWGSAGDNFLVGDNSAETKALAMTLTSPGTAASPCQILCVNHSGSVPPVSADLRTTATVSVTGANISITYAGFAYVYGVTLSAGNSTNLGGHNFTSTSAWYWKMEAGSLKIAGNNSSSQILIGSTTVRAQLLELVNTTLSFANAGQSLTCRAPFVWRGTTSAVAGTAPTTLFIPAANVPGPVRVTGVDLSALGSGTNLVDVSASTFPDYQFLDCKLGASVSVTTGAIAGQGGASVRLVNCDSTNTNYRYYKQTYQGTITNETTIIRTGGATDGTTPISRKMVSTANTRFYSPLESDPILVWNETTGSSVTVTVEVITDNVTLKDSEAWVEVEYLGTSSFPLGVFTSDRASDVLASGVNQTTSSVTWTTTGLVTPVKQELAINFTPQVKGPMRIKVMLAKASTTMYFCPKADIS